MPWDMSEFAFVLIRSCLHCVLQLCPCVLNCSVFFCAYIYIYIYFGTRHLLINTSQSQPQSGSGGKGPIITPAGSYWIAWKARWLLGAEAMSYQGLWLEPYLINTFADKLLLNLAGNAFHSCCCCEATVLLFSALGFLERCRRHSSVLPVPLPTAAPRAAEPASSSSRQQLELLCGLPEESRDSDEEEFDFSTM